MQSKLFRSLALVALLCSSIPSFAARSKPALARPALEKLMKIPSYQTMGLVFAALSAYKLYARHPVDETKWQCRFNLDTLKNFSKIGSKEYWENIWYLFDDVWVGQCYKSKSIKLDKDGDHRLQVHKGDCLPHGVCGHLDANLKVFSKSMENLSTLLLTYFLLNQYGIVGPIQQKLNGISKDIGNPTHDSDRRTVPVIG